MNYRNPEGYQWDSCRECGTCLARCPVLEMESAEARREMSLLRLGAECRALRECTTCFDCEFSCPEGCHPARLIQERWHEVARRRMLPERARYFLPCSRPSFRTFVMDRFTPLERLTVRSWENLSPAEEVCYPGCNMIVTPLLTRTRALDGLDIRGALDYCCGEMYFRMGLFDELREAARRTSEFFTTLGARKVTILCTAGYYIFTRVLPHFGASFDFEIESYLHYLKRKLDSGELVVSHPLNMRVTVQESCYGKQFGAEYMDIPREILHRAGAEVVEMDHCRESMLCCGIGAGFSPYSAYHPFRLTAHTLRVMREAKRTGADAVATYCSGCMQMFDTGRFLYRTGLPAYHLLELLGMALGEKPQHDHRRFARTMLQGVLLHQGPSLLARKRFLPTGAVSEKSP
mgnify:CR=1 FL=1